MFKSQPKSPNNDNNNNNNELINTLSNLLKECYEINDYRNVESLLLVAKRKFAQELLQQIAKQNNYQIKSTGNVLNSDYSEWEVGNINPDYPDYGEQNNSEFVYIIPKEDLPLKEDLEISIVIPSDFTIKQNFTGNIFDCFVSFKQQQYAFSFSGNNNIETYIIKIKEQIEKDILILYGANLYIDPSSLERMKKLPPILLPIQEEYLKKLYKKYS